LVALVAVEVLVKLVVELQPTAAATVEIMALVLMGLQTLVAVAVAAQMVAR
jgi:hypothetical protein